MDMEPKNEMSQSSAAKETTSLLSKNETASVCPEETKPKKYDSVANPLSGKNLTAAGISRIFERDEASPSAAGEAVQLAERVKKCQEIEEEEVADAIDSYEGMAEMVSPSFGCGLYYGIWLFVCHFLQSFMIQFPLHILLLSVPISIGFMGARYMTECPVNVKLPYAMMVVGVLGTLVLLVRLTLLLHSKFSSDDRLRKWLNNATILLEMLFLLSTIIELCFSFKNPPSDGRRSSNYCNKTFYNFVCSMHNVLITIVTVWITLYFITGQRCTRRAASP